jgi:hypothetical protein
MQNLAAAPGGHHSVAAGLGSGNRHCCINLQQWLHCSLGFGFHSSFTQQLPCVGDSPLHQIRSQHMRTNPISCQASTKAQQYLKGLDKNKTAKVLAVLSAEHQAGASCPAVLCYATHNEVRAFGESCSCCYPVFGARWAAAVAAATSPLVHADLQTVGLRQS